MKTYARIMMLIVAVLYLFSFSLVAFGEPKHLKGYSESLVRQMIWDGTLGESVPCKHSPVLICSMWTEI